MYYCLSTVTRRLVDGVIHNKGQTKYQGRKKKAALLSFVFAL